MSKDFQTLVDMGICDKETALRCYVGSSSVFFPPHPKFVVDSTVDGFKKYWKGEYTLEQLREACYLKSIDGLYKYYGQFLNQEDLE